MNLHLIILHNLAHHEERINVAQINKILFAKSSLIRERYRDFLREDDPSDFLRRFYSEKSSLRRLKKLCPHYSGSTKVFPVFAPKITHLVDIIKSKESKSSSGGKKSSEGKVEDFITEELKS